MFDPDLPFPARFALAITYTPDPAKRAFQWLLAFDLRLQSVIEKAREPMFAQMRMAWWRDALKAPAETRPKGEPLLSGLAAMTDWPNGPACALDLVDAWELGIDPEQGAKARQQRLSALCAAFCTMPGNGTLEPHSVQRIVQMWNRPAAQRRPKVPRPVRPLSVLALADGFENDDMPGHRRGQGMRLSWHALTGR